MSEEDVFELMCFLMHVFIQLNEILILHLHLDFLLIIIWIHVVIYEIVVYFPYRNKYLIFIVL